MVLVQNGSRSAASQICLMVSLLHYFNRLVSKRQPWLGLLLQRVTCACRFITTCRSPVLRRTTLGRADRRLVLSQCVGTITVEDFDIGFSNHVTTYLSNFYIGCIFTLIIFKNLNLLPQLIRKHQSSIGMKWCYLFAYRDLLPNLCTTVVPHSYILVKLIYLLNSTW